MKSANEILTEALKGIIEYIDTWQPEGERAIKGKISLIGEWAREALEVADEAERPKPSRVKT